MKAIETIEWMVAETIETEYLQLWDLDEDTDYTATFGYEPSVRPSAGKYMVLWSDCIDNSMWPSRTMVREDADGITRREKVFIQPDCVLLTDNDDKRNGGLSMILLFKLEE